MEGGTWREAVEIWPGALVSGGSFAVVQHFASRASSFHLITDVVAGVISIVCTALFLRFVWHPKTRFLLKSEREWSGRLQPAAGLKPAATLREIAGAWMPWASLIACCALLVRTTFSKTPHRI